MIAGVGNLLADEILWRARMHPRRPANELSVEELDALRRSVRAAMRDAIRLGGAHTGHLNAHRVGAVSALRLELERAVVGGRTTFWCPACQAG